MPVDKIRVSGDARIEYQSATVNGHKYSYLLSQPQSGKYRATIFLIHGFPDISMGWRYQIPALVDLGLRVVAPDCLGYGRTDAPHDFIHYSHKRCADDIKALAAQLGESKIILGGHDWGAAFAYRIALWHPELVSHLFTVCVPFAPPRTDFTPLEDLVRTVTPNFAYQLQFASGDLEKAVRSKEEIAQVLCGMYGGRTEDGKAGFDVGKGVLLDHLGKLRPSKLVSKEEMEYYSAEFARNGIHGPLNWYRTREVNHKEELSILDRRITVPVLFIQALRDQALPPHLGKSMKKHIPQVTVKEVNTSHWALWEKPEEVNAILTEWLNNVALTGTEQRTGKL